MKKLTTLLVCLMAITVSAQENPNIKVEYVEKYKNWTGANSQNDMLLLSYQITSHYYNPMTLLVDSMLSTPQGTAQYNDMVEAANAAHSLSEHMKRKEMLQLQWNFYNNSAAQTNAMFRISMTDNPLPEGFDLIETDYKK